MFPDTSDYVHEGDVECATLPQPTVPVVQSMPVQEAGVRRARPVPFRVKITDSVVVTDVTAQPPQLTLALQNIDAGYGVALSVFDELRLATDRPRQYTLAPGMWFSPLVEMVGCLLVLMTDWQPGREEEMKPKQMINITAWLRVDRAWLFRHPTHRHVSRSGIECEYGGCQSFGCWFSSRCERNCLCIGVACCQWIFAATGCSYPEC